MGRASTLGYDGVLYLQLVITDVYWPPLIAHHIATRSQRYGSRQFDVSDPEWATQAALDPHRLVGDGRSADGSTIRVIGWSVSATPARSNLLPGRVIKLWLVGDGHVADGTGRWIGRSACEANSSDSRNYWAAVEEDMS